MAMFARICSCGKRVAAGARCVCQRATKAAADRRRPSASARGYGHKWRQARVVFLADNPRCAMPGCNAPATVVDHIAPHKGDMKLFWSRRNWQSLCAPCHNSRKQREER